MRMQHYFAAAVAITAPALLLTAGLGILGDPELHLEFREGANAAALVPAGSDELALDGRLASLGNYEHTDVVWESVALPTGG